MAVDVEVWWPCMAPPEQAADVIMAAASQSMIPYVQRSTINAIWHAQDQIEVNTRRKAWENSHDIEGASLDLGDGEKFYYYANRQWMTDLWLCRFLGGCLDNNDGCTQLHFPTYPI